MEHERGVPPIIHSGWTKRDFDKAEAEVKAQQKQREERLAREGDKQVVKPLQRGNMQHSAAVQKQWKTWRQSWMHLQKQLVRRLS